MDQYNILEQLLSQAPQQTPGFGVLSPEAQAMQSSMPMNAGRTVEISKKTTRPAAPQTELAEPIQAVFQPRQKFPTSAEEFNNLIQRQTAGLQGQREGLGTIEKEIAELSKPQETSVMLPVLMGLNDMFNGTKYLQSYETPAQKARKQKLEQLQLKMGLQKSKNELTDKEIDLFKAQYQDTLGREKLAAETDLAKMKIGADAGRKFTPGQEAADKTFGKEYQDWNAQGGFSGVEKQLNQLEQAAAALEADPSLSGGANTALPDAVRRRMYPEAMRIEQDVKQATQAALRQTLGSQFTEKEGEQIMQRSYDPALPAADNIKKIRAAIQELKTRAMEKDRASKYFEQSGGTLSGYSPAQTRAQGGGGGLSEAQEKRRQELLKKAGGK